jgi:hypothetical protein
MGAIDTTQQSGEFLYSLWNKCWDGCWDSGEYPHGVAPDHQCHVVQTWPITKRTAKRIYFHGGAWCSRQDRERTSFIEIDRFAEDGSAYHRNLRERLYLSPPEIQSHRPQRKSTAELKREMADAHPDRGGNREEFERARDRYLSAKRVSA